MKSKRRRRLWWIAVPVVLLIAAIGWVGIRGLLAKADLEKAQALLSQVKDQASAFDMDGATATMAEIGSRIDSAVSLTSDPVWRAAEATPGLGRNLTVVRELAAAVDGIVDDVVGPLMEVGADIGPSALTPKDGAIDVAPFVAIVPVIAEVNVSAQASLAEVNAIDTAGTISQLGAAQKKVADLLASVAPLLDTANSLAPLLPAALGADAPRTYVVMFQNNAEARALGGTALSFAVVGVDKGKIALSDTVPAGFNNFTHYLESTVPVPDGVEAAYPGFGRFIANATERPSFVTAAEITQSMWVADRGFVPDGIISIDPVALSYVLRATDPITLSTGDILTSESLVPLLVNSIYLRFNSGDDFEDNALQDVVYNEAVHATFDRMTSGPMDPKKLFSAILQGWNEHRILFWSSHPEEQQILVDQHFERGLPLSDSSTDRVGIYLQDNVGSKLSYYLRQSIAQSQAVCRADGLSSYRVRVALANTLAPEAVSTLSNSITGQWAAEGLDPGVQRLIVRVYSPPGSTIVGASLDGNPIALQALHDTDYPVGRLVITLPPGVAAEVDFDIVAAAGTRTLKVENTPLTTPTPLITEPLDCATVPVG